LGAITSTFSIFPQLAIAIDVTFGIQNGVGQDKGFDLGKGPAIFTGISGNRDLANSLIKTAEKYGIPYTCEAGILSHTDADLIELVRTGIPVTRADDVGGWPQLRTNCARYSDASPEMADQGAWRRFGSGLGIHASALCGVLRG